MRIQTLNLQGKAFTLVQAQIAKADIYCFQEVSRSTFSQLNGHVTDSGKTRLGTFKLARTEYSMVARDGTKITGIAGVASIVGDSPDSVIVQANDAYPDVIRPMVSMEDSGNDSVVFSIHAPSGKDECAVIAILNFVEKVRTSYSEYNWYIAGDMNTTPSMFAKSFCIKSFKPRDGTNKFVKVATPTVSGIAAHLAQEFLVCVDANTHTGGRSLDYLITNDPAAVVEEVGMFFAADHLPVVFSVSDP